MVLSGLQLRYLHINVNYNNHLTDTVLKDENKPSTASLAHQHLAQLTECDKLQINHKALAKLIHLARALYLFFIIF
ncbi:hypothetical protein BFP66_02850 [Streptococcus suis]|nr:hypothetical protein BFP66_02850 [Streptococcus suis]